jgi:hypothetical protein
MNNDYSRWTGVPERGILSEANLLAKDPAKIWGKTDEAAPPKTSSLLPNADGYRSSDSALFDIDIPVAVGGSNDRVADMATITGEHNSSTMESVPSDVAAVDRKAFMESIQTDKIPCPRLCSATFCFGTGNIVGALCCHYESDNRWISAHLSRTVALLQLSTMAMLVDHGLCGCETHPMETSPARGKALQALQTAKWIGCDILER